MRKILIAAPVITPPWSEGRKNFIRDLIPPLSEHWDVAVLSTRYGEKMSQEEGPIKIEYVDCRSRFLQLSALHRGVKKKLSSQNRPDAILHFPFATFTGFRGLANKRSMIKISRMARQNNVQCLTILYSLTRGNLKTLSRKIGLLAASGGKDWDGPVVNIGINMGEISPVWQKKNTKKLLFMSGFAGNEKWQLKNILYVRGLIDILKIGDELASHGFSLTIAAPLLQFPERLKELLDLSKNMAPSLEVNIETLVDVRDLFSNHSLYLFPFRENQTRFTPTSVLEAMASGIPLVISDLPMLDSVFDSNSHCLKKFAAGNSEALLEAILEGSANWDQTVTEAGLTSDHARKFWDIHNSAKQIVDIVEKNFF